jgi:short-subunit dehydrogenase
VLLVARREARLRELADELAAHHLAADVTSEDAPRLIGDAAADAFDGRLELLVNNAGKGERATFAEGGWENVDRAMQLNFNAVVRLTERLLPTLRGCAPSAIVNVASLAGRLATPGRGAYSASKFALVGWSEALRAETHRDGVHVCTVLPGYVATEGTPQEALVARGLTRWLVSDPDRVARAIASAVEDRQATVVVPRPWTALLTLHALAPGVVGRLTRQN